LQALLIETVFRSWHQPAFANRGFWKPDFVGHYAGYVTGIRASNDHKARSVP
jgi:hypothetical protein